MTSSVIRQSLERLPPTLYKYCGVRNGRINWIRRYLVESELYFASMDLFNDPLDCRIPFAFDAADNVATAHWKRFAALAAPHATPEEHQRRIAELIEQTKTEDGRRTLHEVQFRASPATEWFV